MKNVPLLKKLCKKCKIGENRINTVNYTVKRHTNSSKICLYRNVNDSGLFRRDLKDGRLSMARL